MTEEERNKALENTEDEFDVYEPESRIPLFYVVVGPDTSCMDSL